MYPFEKLHIKMLYVLLACLCWQVKQWWLLSIRSSGLYTVVAHTHARDCLWWFRRKVELRNCVWTELASFDAEVKYMDCVYSVTENVRHGCWPLYCVLQSEVPMWWPCQRRPHAHPTHELNYFWMCVGALPIWWLKYINSLAMQVVTVHVKWLLL